MAGKANPDTPPQAPVAVSEKNAASLLVPIVTAVVLIAAFCLYYFVYVRARREYLANRDFRALAVLGEQLQMAISNHGSVLENYADEADHDKHGNQHAREKTELTKFLAKKQQEETEARRSYLKYLARNFQLNEIPHQSKHGSRLQVQRRDGRWELVLTASGSEKAKVDYRGSLDLQDLLRPFVGSLPFDDILVASETGSIVYEQTKTGPQFTTLTSLLENQMNGQEKKPKADSGGAAQKTDAIELNADKAWQSRSMHLTEVMLAGTRYKLFLQPVLVDVFSDFPNPDEPSREWVLCGLVSSAALEWEALAISYTVIIWLTALFLVICLSGPVLKIFFLNKREHLRLREMAFLGLFLVLMGSVFTLSALQAIYFHVNDDDTEEKLTQLGDNLSSNIHLELGQMRKQLLEMCAAPQLRDDLKTAENKDKIRKGPPAVGVDLTPEASKYPYFKNVFWTDYDGHQVVKWSTNEYVTPMIDISRLSFYRRLKEAYEQTPLYLDSTGPPFAFDSVLPPNKLEYLAALGMTTCDCNPDLCKLGIKPDVTDGSAFLVAQPFSLIDPILPFGYGFTLVDRKGRVLFHNDKTRNMRENFHQESDWNKELYAAMFGHANKRSLRIKYMGKDYRARVIPVQRVAQAPWSLIVYRDLTFVRTLNLQAMTMAATLFLSILTGPLLFIAIWCAVRRPRYVPEWLWPHEDRMATYWYQIPVYTLLIVLFLFLGFQSSSEESLIACAAIPYIALLSTFWCFRLYPSSRDDRRTRSFRKFAAPAAFTLMAAIAVVFAFVFQWAHLKELTVLVGFGAIAFVPLLDRPREYLITRFNHQGLAHPQPRVLSYRACYALSVLLLLLLIGVLTPLALFRASLNVERRLRIKQAQLHLASALERRQAVVRNECEGGERGVPECREFYKQDGAGTGMWRQAALAPLYTPDANKWSFDDHSAPPATELYSGWFRRFIYLLHHDYNQAAAEMLGVIPDRGAAKGSNDFPDWDWHNDGGKITLRKHGSHPLGEAGGPESDLVIESNAPAYSSKDGVLAALVAAGVILVIGSIFWAIGRKVFLFHVLPLKITGARLAEQSIREGRNVLILVPPVSNWQLGGPKWTIDLAQAANAPKWAEALDLNAIPIKTVIEIRHFEHNTNDPEIDNQKFVLVQRLTEREDTQVAVVMTVSASAEEHHRMLPGLEPIDLREEPFPWLEAYEGPAQHLIWQECGPMPALWPIGAQLARDIKGENIHTEDGIAAEILERADPYYRLVWKDCSKDQKFVLAQLAADGVLNPANGRTIRQLVRMGLIVKDPQFRIMNESFRRFLRSAGTPQLKQEWVRESRKSGWGKAHGAFVTVMIIVGAFLLTTQNELWQSSAAYVTTAFGALGTAVKLFNTFRSGGATEKAS